MPDENVLDDVTETPGNHSTVAGFDRGRVLRALPQLVVVVVLAVLPWCDISTGGILPANLSSPGSLHLLGLCLVFAALALSYDLLFGFTGLLSFGHALFFAAGAYLAEIAMAQFGVSLWAAAVIAVIAGLLLAVLVGAVSLRVGGIAFAMVTLAFAQAGSIIVNQDPGGLTGGELGKSLTFDKVPDALLGVVNTRHVYWVALLLLVVVYLLVTFATRSAPGRIWQAIRENERRVEVLGLSPYPFKLLVFVVGSVLATACGVVYLLLVGSANPSIITPDFTLSLLVMVVLGGSGNRWGAVIGGFLYSYLDQRLPAFAASDAIQSLPTVLRVPLSQPLFILGTLFVLVILFLPGGIVGTLQRARAGGDSRSLLRAALTERQPGREEKQ
ncbi:branched-chain amino acid ABC transporter permease [Flexivirga oryzae]|uniref:Branched-chain amino acid transport system permease protein n=1 Tax=Flexivirga oryzae TaxID=1794944 RepID=A0A839N4T4_9MICO|nr:branched-chain amino acid ABC transporter permease [Flexivirga oryzae]MBB2892748.1 branched-chain amino acid transport system permease protein [Flexivirga oryzae]